MHEQLANGYTERINFPGWRNTAWRTPLLQEHECNRPNLFRTFAFRPLGGWSSNMKWTQLISFLTRLGISLIVLMFVFYSIQKASSYREIHRPVIIHYRLYKWAVERDDFFSQWWRILRISSVKNQIWTENKLCHENMWEKRHPQMKPYDWNK